MELNKNITLKLRIRYIAAFILLASLFAAIQTAIHITITFNENFSNVINIAGRQRMLSQKIAKEALLLANSDSPGKIQEIRKEFEKSISVWVKTHGKLLSGSMELGLKGKNSKTVLSKYHEIEPYFHAIRDAAVNIMGAADRNFPSGNLKGFRDETGRDIEVILENEKHFLEGMSSITFQYATEADSMISFIRKLLFSFFFIMLATIIIETFFIFRPFEIQIQKDFEEIEKNMILLREQATYDDMTSLFNKRSGMLFLEQEVNKAKRAKTPLTVCFIDLDGLKKVNDTYGHEAGDEMIITFAEILKKTIRSSEISFRYGGDEFVIVFLSSIAQAEKTMTRVIANVEKANQVFLNNNKRWKLDFSYGLSFSGSLSGTTAEQLVAAADEQMYRSKNAKKESRGKYV